jgi:hypothetical protein
MNGLTPGASYVLYADQLSIGAFSVPVPIVPPRTRGVLQRTGRERQRFDRRQLRWSPVEATAGSPVTLDITLNKFSGAPTFITAPDTSVESIPFDITSDGSVVVGGAGSDGPSSAGT